MLQSSLGGCSCLECPLPLLSGIVFEKLLTRKVPRGPKATEQAEQRRLRMHGRYRVHIELILTFFRDRGCCAEPSIRQISKLAVQLAVLDLAGLHEAYLKYKFCYSACIALDQTELPARPPFLSEGDRGDVILGGAFWVFHRHVLHSRNLRYGAELTQLKKGSVTVEKELLTAAIKKTVCALTAERPMDPPLLLDEEGWPVARDVIEEEGNWPPPSLTHTQDQLVAHAQLLVDQVFPPGWYGPQTLVAPSTSGHTLSTRLNQGALGAFQATVDDLRHRGVLLPTISATSEDPEELCLPWVLKADGEWVSRSGLVIGPALDVRPFLQVVDEMAQRPHEREYLVRPVALPEPFKVRVITGGPEGKYYMSRYIQKSTHRQLRNHPCFRLVGQPITADYLKEQVGPLQPEEFYVSGDYTGATDNLAPWLSEAIGKRIALNAGWTSSVTDEYLASLIHHRIWTGSKNELDKYRDGEKGSSNDVLTAAMHKNSTVQRWGQLMGSPASFPVLCVANLALTSFSLLKHRYLPTDTRQWPIAINGDDVGFRATPSEYETWKEVTSAGGLEPSLGKNFTSKKFLVLNSQFFKVEGGDPELFRVQPYINYGILNGSPEDQETAHRDTRELVCESDDLRTPGLGQLAHELIRDHPQSDQVELLKRFITKWQPHLRAFCPRGMSYWLPTHLGGLGLPVVGEWTGDRPRYSRQQLMMAALLDHDHERQALLMTMAKLKCNDSISVYKRANQRACQMLNRFGKSWRRKSAKFAGLCVDEASEELGVETLLPVCLAMETMDTTLQCSREPVRYEVWRKEREKLFKGAERSQFEPIPEEVIPDLLPWEAHYPDFTGFVDSSDKMDLRVSVCVD